MEILETWKKIAIKFSYKETSNQELLTCRLPSKALYNKVTTTVLSWIVFKPSLFFFSVFTSAIHIILKIYIY